MQAVQEGGFGFLSEQEDRGLNRKEAMGTQSTRERAGRMKVETVPKKSGGKNRWFMVEGSWVRIKGEK